MKKVILVSLIAAISLSAVEWEEENIRKNSELNSLFSVLALDSENNPHIAFWEHALGDWGSLMVAYKKIDTWYVKTVTHLNEWSEFQSLDVDSRGNNYVAYIDFDPITNKYALYLACDSSGEFVTKRLTSDTTDCYLSIVKIGPDGKVHLVYTENGYVRYGWIEDGNLISENVTNGYLANVYGAYGCVADLVIDGSTPHVFYSGPEKRIYHAVKSFVKASSWEIESISDSLSTEPSGGIDSQGILHLAYRKGEYDCVIMYTTNKTGSWLEDTVAVTEMGINEPFSGSLSIDVQDAPLVAWSDYNSDKCALKEKNAWSIEPINGITSGFCMSAHFFRIDKAGYDHITYNISYNGNYHVYYAKSKTPLTDIVESFPERHPSPYLYVDGARILLDLAQASFVRLSLYDASGARVQEISKGFYPSGQNEIVIDRDNLSRGVYFVRLETNGQSANTRIVFFK